MAQQTSAFEVLQKYYSDLGLASLAPKITEYLQQGMGNDQILITLQESKEWKERFAGNEIRRQKGLAPLEPADYLARERQYQEDLRFYGLPKGFYDDPSDYAKLIGANVGTAELRSRLDARKAIVEDGANTGVLKYAQEQYGLTTGDLIAYFTDPDRAAPLLTKIAAASQVGAAAARTKWGAVSAAEAEKMANLGLTANQAQDAFATAAGLTELTGEAGAAKVTRQDLLDAVVSQDEDARRKVTRAQDERRARFASGGSFATSNTGVTGLGRATT